MIRITWGVGKKKKPGLYSRLNEPQYPRNKNFLKSFSYKFYDQSFGTSIIKHCNISEYVNAVLISSCQISRCSKSMHYIKVIHFIRTKQSLHLISVCWVMKQTAFRLEGLIPKNICKGTKYNKVCLKNKIFLSTKEWNAAINICH